jgi:hypothetical protein
VGGGAVIDREHVATGFGRVLAVYPDSWEVDLADEVGGFVRRAVVLTHRLPEPSSEARPQWCLWGFSRSAVGLPWAIPIPSRLVSVRSLWRILEMAGNWRVSLTSAGVYEITLLDGSLTVRLVEEDHRVEVIAQNCTVTMDGPAETVAIHAPATVAIDVEGVEVRLDRPGALKQTAAQEHATDAPVVSINAAQRITLVAGQSVEIVAPSIKLVGVVEVE